MFQAEENLCRGPEGRLRVCSGDFAPFQVMCHRVRPDTVWASS